jgi:hypothetical protein
MLAQWNESLSISENLNRFRCENIFGKASLSRIKAILTIEGEEELPSVCDTRTQRPDQLIPFSCRDTLVVELREKTDTCSDAQC